MSKKQGPVLEFFHPARIALAQEVKQHQDLKELLAEIPAEDFELKLASIAAYCNIVLEGAYYPSELDRLCELLLTKLQAMRVETINTLKGGTNDGKS